jgi:hypothetical protein
MLVKEFTLQPEALELKQLGFDEPCFRFYVDKKLALGIDPDNGDTNSKLGQYNPLYVSAPTYSQAFRFFREKHNLRSFVDTIVHDVDSPNDWIYYFQVKMGNGIDTQPYYSGDFNSYEEAELACLRKLIKKVKASRG